MIHIVWLLNMIFWETLNVVFFLHECRKNLLISEPSQGIMEKFQCHLAPPNIKYNCVVLFLSQLYLLFIYASKYFPAACVKEWKQPGLIRNKK